MARRGPKAAGKSPDKQPLDLIIYKGGIAVLWREGASYRFYNNGEVLIDTSDIDAAYDVVDAFCATVQASLADQAIDL